MPLKVQYETMGKDLPRDCRLYVPITYCLNCDRPIRNETHPHKEYCGDDCEHEHRHIMKLTLEDENQLEGDDHI